MKRVLFAIVCVMCSTQLFAQSGADEPASRDDVILYLRTMHSHDMIQRIMEVQGQSMQALFRDMMQKDKGGVPSDFDAQFKKAIDDLIKGMPYDELTEAMIPAYQKHFTKSDIEAMNTFYSSPVGQKVVHELPEVLQEGNQAAMPIISKYLSDWRDRMQHDFGQAKPRPAKPSTTTDGPDIKVVN